MKLKIFTLTFNRPDILQQQIDSFKKNLKDDYEFNVVYDTRDNKFLDEFKKICDENKVNFYHHQSQPGSSPSFYGADSLQWTYDNIILKSDDDFLVLILDHDMFLIDSFNVNEFMQDCDVAGLPQQRGNITYPWQGLLFFRKSSVESIKFDFYPKVVNGQSLDAGGGMHILLEDKNIKFKPTNVNYPDNYNGIDLETISEGYGFELHLDEKFLHFRNACFWHNNYSGSNFSEKRKILDLILTDLNN